MADDDPLRFFKGLVLAVPFGLVCWLILLIPLWVWLWC